MYREGVDSCFGNILLHFELKMALNNDDTSQQQCKTSAPCHVRHTEQWEMEHSVLHCY